MLNAENARVIGIVGGMGPQAGLALFNSLLCQTGAVKDQQHLSAMLMSFPGDIVDRTAFLQGETDVNPAYSIAEIIRRLERAGAQVIGIACNTSHCPPIYMVIEEQLKKSTSRVKLLHMPEETCRYIMDNCPGARRIGVMATNGTYRSGVYKDMLVRQGLEPVLPDQKFQNEVIHRMIYDPEYGLKSNANPIANKVSSLWDLSMQYFRERGADAIILGCTELSLLPHGGRVNNMLIVDSTVCFAKALIREATGVPSPGKLTALTAPNCT